MRTKWFARQFRCEIDELNEEVKELRREVNRLKGLIGERGMYIGESNYYGSDNMLLHKLPRVTPITDAIRAIIDYLGIAIVVEDAVPERRSFKKKNTGG